MKVHFALILASALLPVACGQITAEDISAAKDALASMTSDEQAANDLYLDDVTDSAAEDSMSEPESAETANEVKDDIKKERLEQMASMLMKRLDANADGSLSLEEFLIGPDKRAAEKLLDEEKQVKIKEKMTADFTQFAGADKLLSSAELQELLKSAAPRIGRHRHEKFPGKKHEERVKESASDLIKKFDKDADGKLDATELEAMRNAKKDEMDKFREGRGPKGKHGPDGKGPGGEEGKGPKSEGSQG